MAKITVDIPQESKSFLTDYIIFEDAAKNQSEAVQWCIDSCMKIEKRYGVDACYVAHNNIVLDVLKNNGQEENTEYHVKFYDYKEPLVVFARNFTIAGVMATAHCMIEHGVGWGIEYIFSVKTGNKCPFEIG